MANDATYGSYLLDEDEFVAAVEECRFAIAEFRHADHIRLAWIYVRRYGARQAEERIVETIRRFAISQGHERKYHGTLTRAWLRLVATAQHLTPGATAFDEFLAKHGWLLDRSALSVFYSIARLSSEGARNGWADPDRRPLPCVKADGGFDSVSDADQVLKNDVSFFPDRRPRNALGMTAEQETGTRE